jgi:hypothetical protein
MIDKTKIVSEFNRIKSLGYIKSQRPTNRDGGIGNTFEDHLGVSENNLRSADFEGFEVKSKRLLNESYITLFSKSPSHPKGANALLKEKYGEVRDPEFPQLKKLYASIFGNRTSLVYNSYEKKLIIDRENQKLILHIKDIKTDEVYDEVYWDFNSLINASGKMKSLFVVFADQKEIDNVYKTGKNYGKPHDHGSGFRVKKENLKDVYRDYFEIE